MNKMLKAALLLITVLVVLTACGPNRSQKDIESALNRDNRKEKPEQLTMWVDGDAQMAFYKKITVAYTKKTGISVRLVNVAQNDQLENLSLDAPAVKDLTSFSSRMTIQGVPIYKGSLPNWTLQMNN